MQSDPFLLRSRAEIVFAELLAHSSLPSAEEVSALCQLHPPLASELQRMLREITVLRSITAELSALSSPQGPPLVPGFECLQCIGRGGMGEVWEARDLALRRAVAIKFLSTAFGADDVIAQRFEREAQAASKIRHPAIVAVHSAGHAAGRSFIVQELVPGGRTLRDEIAELRARREPPSGHARRFAQRFAILADALAAAHAAGIVHRDFKPQNVLCGAGDELKIADFGLAHVLGEDGLSRSGEFLGTFAYASPEQLAGLPVDPRSDVYSLGATLYECLTLERPFESNSAAAIARAVATTEPTPAHVRAAWVPEDLSWICTKALEKRPSARYATMAALREDLTAFLSHRPLAARRPPAWQRVRKWCRRHPTAASAIALTAVAFVALLTLVLRVERLRRDAVSLQQVAESQTDEARRESEARRKVVDFLIELFDRADPEHAEDPRASELVARGIEDLRGADLEPPVRARLLTALGAVQARLGHFAEAGSAAREALALWADSPESDASDAVEAELLLANTLLDRGEPDALARFSALVARWHARRDLRPEVAIDSLLGAAACSEGETAVEYLDEAEALARELGGDPPRQLWRIQDRRVRMAKTSGDLVGAEAQLELIFAERAHLSGTGSIFWLEPLANRALVTQALGRFEEAHHHYETAHAEIEAGLGPNHPRAFTLANNWATLFTDEGRDVEAEERMRDLLRLRAEALGDDDEGLFVIRYNLAASLLRQQRFTEGRAESGCLAQDIVARFGPRDPRAIMAESGIAASWMHEGRLHEAADVLQRLVALCEPGSALEAQLRNGLELCREQLKSVGD